MSEVIFKNEFGEYKVGDTVYAVAQGYGHTPNIYEGVILGIKNGRLKLEVTELYTQLMCGDATYDSSLHGRRATYGTPASEGFETDTGKWVRCESRSYKRKTTIYANRVMPRTPSCQPNF